MDIVIVGASFAGLSAALECAALYPEATILLLDKEKEVGYFPNALNWKTKGQIDDWSQAKSRLVDELGISPVQLCLERECIGFLPDEQAIQVRFQGEISKLSYDYLILAMGAHQVWEGQADGVDEQLLLTKSFSQGLESMEKIRRAKTITVIGAGQIGLESLDAFSHLGISLRLIEAQDWPLAKYFDQEMVEPILSILKEQGIALHFSEAVNRIERTEDGLVRVETLQDSYLSDYLVLGTSFRPNSERLKGLVNLHSDGSVLVDDYLETSQQRIFAIGDMIHMPFAFFGRAYLPMINHAILTGRLVAHNLLRKEKALKEVERIISSRIFGYNVTSVGLTEREASLWLDTSSVRISQSFSHWNDEWIDFKLVVSQVDGRVLGGQLVSKSNQIEQMNVLAMAISQQLTVDDLLRQSWLCLPGRTDLVPFLLEAANRYQLQQASGR